MAIPVTIIGAGIGGLTTALALKQSGHEVTIYEGAPEIKPVGAGIVMANNAMQIFDKLGVREQIEQAGCKISSIKITDAMLNTISSSELSKFEDKYGVYNVAIHRAELQRILGEEIGFENIQLSKRLKAIEGNGPYTLLFEDNTRSQCEVLIGADGIRSKVRTLLFEPSRIRDTRQRCWRGVSEIDWISKYDQQALEAWGRGKRFGFVKIGGGKIYWYAVVNEELLEETKSPEQLFPDFHPDVLRIIRETTSSQLIFSDIIDLKPINSWCRGQVCLIGDAAHATTPNMGQGACQAVEDAYVLGQLFAQNLQTEEVFKRYEQLRMSKAHFIVNTSWTLGKVAHFQNSFACWVRNTLLRSMPASANERQMERVFDINYAVS